MSDIGDATTGTSGNITPTWEPTSTGGTTGAGTSPWTTLGGTNVLNKSTQSPSQQVKHPGYNFPASAPNLALPSDPNGSTSDLSYTPPSPSANQQDQDDSTDSDGSSGNGSGASSDSGGNIGASTNDPSASTQQNSTNITDAQQALMVATGTTLSSILQQLKTQYNLTDQQVSDMEYAFYNPSQGTAPALALLSQYGVNAAVQQSLSSNGFTLTSDWPMTSDYNIQLNTTADENFEEQVSLQPYSDIQKNQLMTAYYHGTPLPTSPDDLQSVFDTMMSSVSASMPDGWTSSPNSAEYDGEINSAFLNTVNNLYNSYTTGPPSASQADAQQVAQALAILNSAPGTTPAGLDAIPANLVVIATGIRSSAISQTQQTYSYAVWTPPPGPGLPSTQDTLALNTVDTATNLLNLAYKYATRMPNSPEKMMLLNFLQIVSTALEQLKNELYSIEQTGATEGIGLSNAQQEAMEYKIKVHYKQLQDITAQQAEISKQAKKQSKWGGIMNALMPVIAVLALALTVASAGTLGPVAFAMCVAISTLSVVDAVGSAAGKNLGLVSGMMNSLATGIADGLSAAGVNSPWVKVVAQVAILVALTVAGGSGAAMAGVSRAVTFSTVLSSTSTVNDICTAANLSDQTAIYAQLASAGLCAVVGMGGGIRVATMDTEQLAGRLAGHVAELSESIANPATGRLMKAFNTVALKITENGLDNVNGVNGVLAASRVRYLETGVKATQLVGAGVQVTNSVLQYQLDMAQAALQPIVAAANANDANMEDLVNDLQAALQVLEKFLSSISSWISSVGNQNLQTFQTMEQITSQMS
jgi:hypothetical protein